MAKKINILILILVIVVPSYWFYVEYFWNNFYDNHSYWRNTELPTYNFKVVNAKKEINNKNFTEYHWHRTIIEPNHGIEVLEETISFLNDSTMILNSISHWVHENQWTFPAIRKFYGEKNTMDYEYRFIKNEMKFIREFVVHDKSSSDTVHIELSGNKLAVKYFFP
tara:strand:+ start:9367 stop:9864 length:498 start_codon:yes stop_codon:yes gene_type:complete